MLSTVDLYDEIGSVTDEINNVTPNRSLPTKARAAHAMRAQRSPYPPLGVG
jgi:hypothetical protein